MQNRVTVSVEHEAASIRQILDAGDYLDGADLYGINGHAFSRAHFAFSGSVFALA